MTVSAERAFLDLINQMSDSDLKKLGLTRDTQNPENPSGIAISEKVKTKYELLVSNLLKDLGIPAHLLGYRYLRYAILISLSDSTNLDSMTKILYPTIARKFGATPPKVERAIRHAIEVSMQSYDVSLYNELFSNTVRCTKEKPTNSQFIATIVDYLRLNY